MTRVQGLMSSSGYPLLVAVVIACLALLSGVSSVQDARFMALRNQLRYDARHDKSINITRSHSKDRFDDDKDGYVSWEEFQSEIQKLGFSPEIVNSKKLSDLFWKADLNEDGKLSDEEFVKANLLASMQDDRATSNSTLKVVEVEQNKLKIDEKKNPYEPDSRENAGGDRTGDPDLGSGKDLDSNGGNSERRDEDFRRHAEWWWGGYQAKKKLQPTNLVHAETVNRDPTQHHMTIDVQVRLPTKENLDEGKKIVDVKTHQLDPVQERQAKLKEKMKERAMGMALPMCVLRTKSGVNRFSFHKGQCNSTLEGITSGLTQTNNQELSDDVDSDIKSINMSSWKPSFQLSGLNTPFDGNEFMSGLSERVQKNETTPVPTSPAFKTFGVCVSSKNRWDFRVEVDRTSCQEGEWKEQAMFYAFPSYFPGTIPFCIKESTSKRTRTRVYLDAGKTLCGNKWWRQTGVFYAFRGAVGIRNVKKLKD